MEIWEPVAHKIFGHYYHVSTLGRVKRIAGAISKKDGTMQAKPECILKIQTDSDNYGIVCLSARGKRLTKKVHRLVAEVFVDNPNALPSVNHKDGIKKNNKADNLEWCSVAYNNKHAYSIGIKSAIGSKNGSSKFDEALVKQMRAQHQAGMTTKEVSKHFNVSQASTSRILTRKTWKHC